MLSLTLAQDWHWPSVESAFVEVRSTGSASGGPRSLRPSGPEGGSGGGGGCHVYRRGGAWLVARDGRGRGLVQVHEAFSKNPFQTKALPACAESCDEEEEQQHRPDREADVQVIYKAHIHPVDRVSHVSCGRWFPLAHQVPPLEEEPLQLSGLLKECPRTVGPLVRWWCGQLLRCSVSESPPG